MEAALWRDVPPTHVQVAGIAVRDSTITDLALLLSEAGNSTLANTSGKPGTGVDRRCLSIPRVRRRSAVLEPIRSADVQPL
jgi:hypothetical protein